MDKSDAKKINDRLFEIKKILDLFIKGKSQRLRNYINKTIVIENNTGSIKGTLISVTDNWIEIQWESESPAEDKSGITFMAIDHITAFCLAKEDNGQTS